MGAARRYGLALAGALAACGPDVAEPDVLDAYEIAVMREEAAEGQLGTRVVVVDGEGTVLRRFENLGGPESEYEGPWPDHRWLGWAGAHRGAYVMSRESVHVGDERGVRSLPCRNDSPSTCGLQEILGGESREVSWRLLPSGHFVVAQSTLDQAGCADSGYSFWLFLLDEDGSNDPVLERRRDTRSSVLSVADGDVFMLHSVVASRDDQSCSEIIEESEQYQLFDGSTLREWPTPQRLYEQPRLSPSGEMIAWTQQTETGFEVAVDTTDGEPVTSAPAPPSARWSADSRQLVDVSDDRLWVLDVQTGSTAEVVVPGAVGRLAVGTGGEGIALALECSVDGSSGTQIAVIDPWDGGSESLRSRCIGARVEAWSPDGKVVAAADPNSEVERFRVVSLPDGRAGPWIEGDALSFRPPLDSP